MTFKTALLSIFGLLPLSGNAQDYPHYDGKPWVRNVSRPNGITSGLEGRHIALWASHGKYFDIAKGEWKWQRPYTFCTTEDFYTQSVVNPYLIPMLENAGAVVFTPRERDIQTEEIIVDNDSLGSGYNEIAYNKHTWNTSDTLGFAFHGGAYSDGENPFTAGTARLIPTVRKQKRESLALWQPYFPKAGRYAVYVSYQSLPEGVDDAEYIVYHRGEQTVFHVNQQMGGGTWVYLGSFDFSAGRSSSNRVVLTNLSHSKGVVSADAVRFGGGMGNISRGGMLSGLPRFLEGARYYSQWAGAPYSVYSHSSGADDYKDDINSRSLMLNWLSGGSIFEPSSSGKHVPIELSLALHTDAGYSASGIIGTLGICTTSLGTQDIMGLKNGRTYCRTFAETVQSGVVKALSRIAPGWNSRGIWDRNYSETRNPDVPSTIVEALAHQNFNDMCLAHDPYFKFVLARSIYVSILDYLSKVHDFKPVIAPLAPVAFSAEVKDKEVELEWKPATDSIFHSVSSKFIVYSAVGNSGYDNGTLVSKERYSLKIVPGLVYRFRVSAVNSGGESFKSEELVAYKSAKPRRKLLIVNGFTRLAGPLVINSDSLQGFDIDADPGVADGQTTAFAGRQLCFEANTGGGEGPGTLGYSGSELEGMLIGGNTFNYPAIHANAIAGQQDCDISSCSVRAVENGSIRLDNYNGVDLILGCQRRDGYSLSDHQSISFLLSEKLSSYHYRGGVIMVSGAYTGFDMTRDADKQFMRAVLGVSRSDTLRVKDSARGLGCNFKLAGGLVSNHCAVSKFTRLGHAPNAFCAMQYDDGTSAAVASQASRGRTFVMGFPFENIDNALVRRKLMNGIWTFLFHNSKNEVIK